SLSVFPALGHAQIDTRTHCNSACDSLRFHSRTHTLIHTQIHAHTYTHTHTHAHRHTRARGHTHTCTYFLHNLFFLVLSCLFPPPLVLKISKLRTVYLSISMIERERR